ncbi:SAM-dependent methyltransferase [Neiella sp. HB171785]|uniref:tRNA (guanine(46)-N(7))-methyltransferase n=1 Tax=Neiella litorisoli TaxID=2771431 RepID=A0A8J6QHX1_9GAMM|nr:SAM-dependent methyltransferase [Neiella litorisoli]MBD1390110.1 SAM-dependent methyltransferase [Neiella litorisoli]
MAGNSKQIVSNQPSVHEHLAGKVNRHLSHPFKKPVAEHTLGVFRQLNEQVQQWQGPVILDACCGVGESTKVLAACYPDSLVVGIDKSACRIDKGLQQAGDGHYVLARADLNDLWRLVWAANWPLSRQFILYPNPWPKAEHLGRRWHGAGVFPYILAAGGVLTVRSNWHIYIEEIAQAMTIAGLAAKPAPYPTAAAVEPMTPFERKYWQSGHDSTQVEVDLAGYQAPQWLQDSRSWLQTVVAKN